MNTASNVLQFDYGHGISLELDSETQVAKLYLKNYAKRNVLGGEFQEDLIRMMNIVEEASSPSKGRMGSQSNCKNNYKSDSSTCDNKPAHNTSNRCDLNEDVEKTTEYKRLPFIRALVITTPEKNQTWCAGMDLNPTNQAKLKQLLSTSTSQKITENNANGSTLDQGYERKLEVENSDPSSVEKVIRKEFLKVFEVVSNASIPTVAFIRGPVIGGGLGLMLSCDYIVVDKDCEEATFFQFSEVKRGLVPALISLYIVPKIGVSVSKRLMMSGIKVSCQDALSLGMIHSIDRYSTVERFTSHIREGAPFAIQLTKKLVQSYQNSNSNQVSFVLQTFGRMMKSDEAKYGISCFMKKENPNWTLFHQQKLPSKL